MEKGVEIKIVLDWLDYQNSRAAKTYAHLSMKNSKKEKIPFLNSIPLHKKQSQIVLTEPEHFRRLDIVRENEHLRMI